jgi:hypothetical protein
MMGNDRSLEMRRENEILQQEREILKKGLVI